MSKLRTFLRLPMREKLMLPEALVLSGYYRYLILHRPFARISPKSVRWGVRLPRQKSEMKQLVRFLRLFQSYVIGLPGKVNVW